MATYKVLQDIEAEDKLFGPLTLKQFIFAGITIVIGFIQFRLITAGIPIFIKLPLILTFLPFFLVFGFLATPIGRDQPNEIWLLARLRFLFKPRTRIWNQEGMSELVTITAPKRIEKVFVNDYTQDEVKSRLRALASTMDSRGWAVKNVNTNMFAQPGYLTDVNGSDRLVDPGSMPQEVPLIDLQAADDMLDPVNNSTAQHFDRLIQQTNSNYRQEISQKMTNQNPAPDPAVSTTPNTDNEQPPTQTQDYWFMNQSQAPQSMPDNFSTFNRQEVVAPGTNQNPVVDTKPTPEEAELAQKLSEAKGAYEPNKNDRIKTLQPLHDKDGNLLPRDPVAMNAADVPQADMMPPTPVNPALLELAQNNDLNVATIARQAKQTNKPKDDGEVVISLH